MNPRSKDSPTDPEPSQLPGNDGEGPDRTGSLQVQSCQEAVGGLAGALRLQGLAQTAPRLVGRTVDLDCIAEDLLPEVDASGFDQQPTLGGHAGNAK